MNLLLVLPVVLPLTIAAGSLATWRKLAVQRWLGVAGTAGLLAAALALLVVVWRDGIQATSIGNWPAPYGIIFVADIFSALMVVLAGSMGFAIAIYSLASIDTRRTSFGYYPLLHILLMGVCGAFLTGDLFNLFVWFEVMLMASFVLLALGGERRQLEGGIKYVTLNLLSSAVFLSAVGILYGVVGTLNMADLSQKLPRGAATHPGLMTALAMMFLTSFGIKAAIFPLFFWLPASYHTPPVAVSAIFAGLLTKVGVYALIRVFTLFFTHDPGFTHGLILVISGLTMATGVLGAVAQNEFRRVLSFHIISQIGYMTMGLGLAGLTDSPALAVAALAGSVFYIAHHIVVKTNLFLMSGVAHRLLGTFELKHLGGLYRHHPFVALLFLIPALSLAGAPPLSGFFAKLSLVRAGLAMEQYAITATALAVGLLTLFSMTKIWAAAFWKPLPARAQRSTDETPVPRSMVFPIGLLAATTVAIGLAAEPLFQLVTRAASQLLDPREYVRAVLGGSP